MKKWVQKHKLLAGIGAFVAIVLVLMATGVVKFNFWLSRNTVEPVATDTEVAAPEQKGRTVTFGGNQKPEFTMELPRNWDAGSVQSPGIAVAVGSKQLDKQSDGTDFTANVNVIIDQHPAAVSGIADYQAAVGPELQRQFPNAEIVSDQVTTINGMDVYVIEINNQFPDMAAGDRLRQIQYWFFVDDQWYLSVTGTALESTWGVREGQIKSVIESIRPV